MTPSPLAQFLKFPSALIETGLVTMGSALKAAQRTVEMAMGQSNGPLKAPPVDGPGDIDAAVSEFMNRLARIARYTPLSGPELAKASRDIVEAARRSFHYVDLKDPRSLGVPAQMALSFGTLFVQSALRGLATYDVVGSSRMQRLVNDFFELYTEQQVFVGLEYREVIDRGKARLAAAPGDHATRVDLGHTYLKCGLYDEAVEELSKIPPEAPQRGRGMHEAGVALYYSGRYEKAARACVASMTANPKDERVRLLLWLSCRKLGGYPEYVPAAFQMEVTAGFERPTVEYEDIALKAGLDKTSGGRGVAIFDYDNDGYLDVVVASAFGNTTLYHNNGDGTFSDVSIGSGLETCVNTFGVTAGDYDNDGYPDLLVTRLGFYGGDCQLFHNNGDGTFTDVTAEAGLQVWGPAFAASWVDYDGDGFLDLFIANNLGGLFERKTPNRLFHNNGDGTFTEVTSQAGLDTMWPSIGGAWGDYDNDGRPDLFLSNGLGRSQLYHNNGDGTFTDVSEAAGVAAMGFGSVPFWWDYDNDGWMDIGQFTWSDHEDAIYTLQHGEGPPDGQPMRVYHNNRDGTFTQVNRDIGLNGCWGTMSGNAADLNNDGYLDVVLGNGSPKMERMDPMVVMETDGTRFRNTTFAAGLPFTGKSHGVVVGDLFGDGRLSILVGAGGAYPADLLTMGVFYPKSLPGNYVNVRLRGVQSNRSAIGAKVTLEAGGRKQYREVSGGSNFGCMPFEQHFGLGKAVEIEGLEIRWPSGLRQRFGGLQINKSYQFTEGEPGWEELYVTRLDEKNTIKQGQNGSEIA
jgi:tetratricopeptide (TPR) repeat protein